MRFTALAATVVLVFALGCSSTSPQAATAGPTKDKQIDGTFIDKRLAPPDQILYRSSATTEDAVKRIVDRALAIDLSLFTEAGVSDAVSVHKVTNISFKIKEVTYFDYVLTINPKRLDFAILPKIIACLNGERPCERLKDGNNERPAEPNWYQFNFGSSVAGVAKRCASRATTPDLVSCGLTAIHADGTGKAPSVSVGIPDSGAAIHDDLPGLTYAPDASGHGTHLAGIIGAALDGYGIVGVAPQAKLFAYSFLDANGHATADAAIKALEDAATANPKPDVILIAWGTVEKTGDLCNRIDAHRDILFVAAAGNLNQKLADNPVFPASCKLDNVISVMATECSGRKASFSNFGAEIAAPGDDPGNGLCSTVLGNLYGRMSGTSVAAVYVAGSAALVKETYPNLVGAGLKDRLVTTAGTPTCLLCAKMLDVAAALK
jgi:subtilisin family serine protease